MKITLLLLTFSASAFAAAPAAKTATVDAKPVRMAHAHGSISQTFYSQDRKVKPTSEKLCDFDKDVPVYAASDDNSGQTYATLNTCDVNLNGQQLRVELQALVNYKPAKDGEAEEKQLSAIMLTFESGTGALYSVQQGYVSSEDLSVRSLNTYIGATNFEGKQFPQRTDYFEASLNLTDLNQ